MVVKPLTLPKWEYKSLYSIDDAERNYMGNEGWEAYAEDQRVTHFKRRKN